MSLTQFLPRKTAFLLKAGKGREICSAGPLESFSCDRSFCRCRPLESAGFLPTGGCKIGSPSLNRQRLATALPSEAHGVELRFIRPGKPIENAYVESFTGKFREECLNEHWFISLADAKAVIEAWLVDYNTVRHASLGQQNAGGCSGHDRPSVTA
jgi:integrase-like protein